MHAYLDNQNELKGKSKKRRKTNRRNKVLRGQQCGSMMKKSTRQRAVSSDRLLDKKTRSSMQSSLLDWQTTVCRSSSYKIDYQRWNKLPLNLPTTNDTIKLNMFHTWLIGVLFKNQVGSNVLGPTGFLVSTNAVNRKRPRSTTETLSRYTHTHTHSLLGSSR